MFDPVKVARIRRARPLADLSKGFATAVPTAHVAQPPPPDQAWGCLGPLRGSTRWVCTVTAPSAFKARELAAIELQCEPGELQIARVE